MHMASSCSLAANGSEQGFDFTLAFNKQQLVCYAPGARIFYPCHGGLLQNVAIVLAIVLNNSTLVQRAEARRQACSDLAPRYWAQTAQRRSEPRGAVHGDVARGGVLHGDVARGDAGRWRMGCSTWLSYRESRGLHGGAARGIVWGTAQGSCTGKLHRECTGMLHGDVARGHCLGKLHGVIARGHGVGDCTGVLHGDVAQGHCLGKLHGDIARGHREVTQECWTGMFYGTLQRTLNKGH